MSLPHNRGRLAAVTTHDDPGEFLELLYAVVRGLHRDAAHAGSPLGTTPGQVRLLRTLSRCDGPRRLGELAVALDVAPRSVTSKVDQAEEDGWVRRVDDPHDRRATLVELTPAGRAVLDEIAARRQSGAAERLARLDADERARLLDMLRRMGAPGPE